MLATNTDLLTSITVEVVHWRQLEMKVQHVRWHHVASVITEGWDDRNGRANFFTSLLIDIAMLSTIALFSSSRRLGNTGQLMDRIALQLGIEVIDLASQHLSPYDYEHRNRSDDFEPLMQRVLAHDQIIFATPIYWYAVSPAMKVFLDRISDFLELPDLLPEGRRLRGKSAYIVCTSISDEASDAFMSAFRETFKYLGVHLGGAVHINCRDGYFPAMHDSAAGAFAAVVRNAGSAERNG